MKGEWFIIYPMKNNISGIKTKEIIIQACQDLFYEKGYANTSFGDIKELTGIFSSVIVYHFRSKENLHHAVLDIYFRNRSACARDVLRNFGLEEKYLQTMLDVYFDFHNAYTDEKFRRFICEKSIPNPYDYSTYLRDLSPIFSYDPQDPWQELNLYSCSGADTVLWNRFLEDFDENRFRYDEIAEYAIRLLTRFFPYDRVLLEQSFEKINTVLKEIRWEQVDVRQFFKGHTDN